MEITINVPDEVAAAAQARGLTPHSFVEELVAKKLVPAKPPQTKEQRLADLERFFEEISRNSENIPLPPDEAFTRESLYSDHD